MMIEDLFGGATRAFVTAVLVAVVTQAISNRIRLPPILFWLLAGMLLGPWGVHILFVEDIQPALHTLIELGLAVIMFEGGLNLNLRALKKYGSVIVKLLLLGPLITMFIGGLAAHELTPSMGIEETMATLVVKFLIGSGVGWAGGWLLSRLLNSEWLKDAELRSITTLAATWGIFLTADSLSSQAGLLAALVAGTTLQQSDLPDIQRLKYFKASLSVLLVSVLFVLLAADLDLSLIGRELWSGLAIFGLLALIARPLSAWLSSLGSDLSQGQVIFLSGMAPRGVIAAAITSLFSLILMEQGHNDVGILQALVYITIIASVLLYGLLARPMSQWLGVDGIKERSLLIIGGGQMGAEVGRMFAEDREVRFLDLNEEVVQNLKRAGYQAIQGNALDPISMDIAHAEEVSAIIVMTGSSDHNLLIAQLAHDEFHVRDIYIALQEGDESKHRRMLQQLQARRLFGKPYHFTYWNDQAYRKRLVYEVHLVEDGSGLAGHRLVDARIPHGVQPLAIMRDGQIHISHDDFRLAAGDNIWLLLRPDRTREGQALLLPPEPETS